jgi:hypothetical protein
MLNAILTDLDETNDFDIIRSTTTLSIGPGLNTAPNAGYLLPSTYLRSREVYYSVNGTIFYLNQLPLQDYDQLFQGPGIDNYPESYATNVSQNDNSFVTMYFWPPPAQVLSVTVRFQTEEPVISTPETSSVVPWFPNPRYLYTKLAAELMALTADTRREEFLLEAGGILDKFLIMGDDKEGFAQTIKLDARNFRNPDGLKPTKVTGF